MFRIIGPILSILIAGTVFIFFVRPMYAEIKLLQEEANEYGVAVSKAADFNELLDSLVSKRNIFSAYDLERLDAFLPSEIDEVQVLTDLESLATKHGLIFDQVEVELDSVDFESTRNETIAESASKKESDSLIDKLTTRNVSFVLLGNYDQFKSFLLELERSLVLMEVMSIGFESSAELTSYHVTVRLYAIDEDARTLNDPE